MDKVLKYKFWILSALVLPLALTGFFLASGGIKAGTEERVTQLKGISAPNANQPNPPFTAVAKQLADQQERDNNQQLRELDTIQRIWFKWPSLIANGLEKKPDTGELVYRGENIPPNTLRQISVLYPEEYKNELLRVWLSVNPVVPTGLPYSDKSKNKIFCPIEILPFHTLGQTPKVADMWDAQEDLWLMEMLFTAINTTNQAATNVNDAAIREISYLNLFGGSGESSVLASATAAEGGAAPEGGGYMGGGSEFALGGSASGAGGAPPKFADGGIAYDPAMEYGSTADVAAAAGGAEGGESSAAYMDGGLFGGGGTAAAKPLRYVGFDKDNPGPYRKRGFYLALLIQEKKIPDFVVNLANLDPPIYAGRWGFANNPYDTDHLLRAARGTSGGAGAGYGASYMEGAGGGSGGGGAVFTRPKVGGSAFGSSAPGYGGEETGGMGGAGGGSLFGSNDPRFPPLRQAQLLEMKTWESSKLGKDLVLLEISGLVTIFTPDVPPPTPEEPAASGDAAAPEVAPPVQPAAPAAESATEAPAAETSATETPATTPATDPAATSPPAEPAAPAADTPPAASPGS